jgi:hypothetical protein
MAGAQLTFRGRALLIATALLAACTSPDDSTTEPSNRADGGGSSGGSGGSGGPREAGADACAGTAACASDPGDAAAEGRDAAQADGSGDVGAGDASDGAVAPPDLPGGPLPIVSAPEVLGVLVGPDATYPQQAAQMYGTDLGFPFVNDGKLFLLFGDSIATTGSICDEPANDDALGSLPLAWGGTVPELELVRRPAAPERFARIELVRDGVSQQLGVGQVPIGGFVDGGRVFALFNRLQFERCVADGASARCPSGEHFTCTERIGVCEPTRNVVVPPLCDTGNGSGCMAGQTCAPADPGFCVDATSSQNDGSVAGEIASVVQTIELGIARPDDPSTFDHAAAFSTNKFVNPSVRAVASWSGRREGSEYGPGEGALLVFGRPGFVGEGRRQVQLYLMVQPLPIAVGSGGAATLTPVYFAGIDPGSSEPRWSIDQSEARPIALDGEPAGDPHEALPLVNQMSVSWLGAPVNKWVMLYGGDISDLLVLDAPALRTGPSPGAIMIRFADHPWGPFSAPEPHLMPGEPGVIGDGYGPGGHLYHSACRDVGETRCAPPDAERAPLGLCPDVLVQWDQGRLYGAIILDPYTVPNAAGGLDMIWTVSTWNPYHVLMMRTSLDPR